MPISRPVSELRQLLAARFPTATRREESLFATGIETLDSSLGGGLPTGALSEFVAQAPSCGGQLLIESLLRTARRARLRAVLVDAGECFDPDGADPDVLPHLLWVRCPTQEAALHVADIVVRDSNIGLVLVDLRGADQLQLRRTPATLWYRLQRAAEPSSAAIVFFTRTVCIQSARCRLLLEHPFHLASLDRRRADLATELTAALQRHRAAPLSTDTPPHVRRSPSARFCPPGTPADDAGEFPAARTA